MKRGNKKAIIIIAIVPFLFIGAGIFGRGGLIDPPSNIDSVDYFLFKCIGFAAFIIFVVGLPLVIHRIWVGDWDLFQ